MALANMNKHAKATLAFSAGLEIEPNNQALKDALLQSMIVLESVKLLSPANNASKATNTKPNESNDLQNDQIANSSMLLSELNQMHHHEYLFEASFDMAAAAVSKYWTPYSSEIIKMIRSWMPGKYCIANTMEFC